MRATTLTLLLLAVTLLSGCQRGPEQDPVPYGRAARSQEVMTVTVTDSWDMVKIHVAGQAPQVTHLVEVTVDEGPSKLIGTTLVLPFDSYATGRAEPPAIGAVEVMCPADWLGARRRR
ncbi:MAG: hypothetical protein ACYTF0_02910 [Planctomycetota bacterium]|jgi:hypothetical protein